MAASQSANKWVGRTVLRAGFLAVLSLGSWIADASSGHAERCTNTRNTEQRKNSRPSPRITVSKETTYILAPLDDEGYVDYLAALNKLSSGQITPHSNAGVPFARASGLPDFKPEEREAFFGMLGAPWSADQTTWFQRFSREMTEKETLAYHKALVGPWTPSDIPLLAEWLRSNEKPLHLVVEGTHQPHCYLPWVKTEGAETLLHIRLPVQQNTRDWGMALAARATLKLGEGKAAEAREDLLACHRLARLIGSTPSLISGLVCVAIEAYAFEGDSALIEHGNLNAKQALQYQAELRSLPPLPVMADIFDRWERLILLGTLSQSARKSIQKSAPPEGQEWSMESAERLTVYWDEVLRTCNEEFDKWSAAARKPIYSERKRELERLAHESRRFIPEDGRVPDAQWFAEVIPTDKATGEIARHVGNVVAATLLPDVNFAIDSEMHARTRGDLTQIGLALAAYRADRGDYPKHLAALVPNYIALVPKDRYTHQELRFTRQENGFLLYSVGQNERDDGGQTFSSEPEGDDIVLRIPRGHLNQP